MDKRDQSKKDEIIERGGIPAPGDIEHILPRYEPENIICRIRLREIKTLTNLFKQDKEKFVVPKGVQDVIHVAAIFDDGIFKVGKDTYSKTYSFTDITYAVASREDKEAMFLEYSELLNSLDSCLLYTSKAAAAFTTVCVDIGGTAVPPAAKVVTGKVLDAADASGSRWV